MIQYADAMPHTVSLVVPRWRLGVDMRLMSPQEQAAELGVRIHRERLRQNLSQATLGRRAGVGRLTVTRMESGDNTNLTNFLAVLSALRRSGDLEKLIETPPAETLDQFIATSEPVRQRGSR